MFKKLAELAGEHLRKGRLVYAEGHLHGNAWTGEDGIRRRSVVVIAENLQFLSPKPAEAAALARG